MLNHQSGRDPGPPQDEETLARSRRLIETHEGRECSRYWDAAGRPVIGVGFNLDRADARRRIEALGVDYAEVRNGRTTLTDAQVDTLLDNDVRDAMSEARTCVPRFDQLPPAKQSAIVDLVFALGGAGFSRFNRMVEAIERGDWPDSTRSVLPDGDDRERELNAADDDS